MPKKTPAALSTRLCCWKGCSCPPRLPLPPCLLHPSPQAAAHLSETVLLFTKVSGFLFSSLFLFLGFKTESAVFLWRRAAPVSPVKPLPQLTRKLLQNNNKG